MLYPIRAIPLREQAGSCRSDSTALLHIIHYLDIHTLRPLGQTHYITICAGAQIFHRLPVEFQHVSALPEQRHSCVSHPQKNKNTSHPHTPWHQPPSVAIPSFPSASLSSESSTAPHIPSYTSSPSAYSPLLRPRSFSLLSTPKPTSMSSWSAALTS